MSNQEKTVILEALVATQRVLAKVIHGKILTNKELDSFEKSCNKISWLLLDEKLNPDTVDGEKSTSTSIELK